jgi:ribosomal protection tetracycline resistance protein
MYIYKNMDGFRAAMAGYVREALAEGLFGWEVTDCVVTMIRCTYSSADGPPATRGPLSSAADFRKLTPLVMMDALRRAGTLVCEPVDRFRLEIPADTLGAVLPALARLGAVPHAPVVRASLSVLAGEVPAARVNALRQELPALTRGEGVLESAFDHYRPVRGPAPTRPRTTVNPLNRKEYLLHTQRRL